MTAIDAGGKRITWPRWLVIESVAAAALLGAGLVCLLVMPLFTADETNHLTYAYAIAHGRLLPLKLPRGRYGAEVPRSLAELQTQHCDFLRDRNRRVQWEWWRGQLYRPLAPQDVVQHDMYATMPGSCFAYLPQAVGVRVAVALGGGPLHCLYAARLGNLLVAVFLLFWTIRLAPLGKGILTAVALCPLSLQMLSSGCPDGLTISLSLLTFAYIARLALSPDVSRVSARQIGFLVLLAGALALSKFTYTAILVVALAIPVARFGSRLRYALTGGLVLVVSVVLAGTYLTLMKGVLPAGHSPTYAGVPRACIPAEQMEYILRHPRAVLFTFGRLFLDEGFRWSYCEFKLSSTIWVPSEPCLYFLIYLCVVARCDHLRGISPGFWFKCCCALGVALGVVATTLSMYTWWTPIGDSTVYGIQARYFMPLLPLGLMLLCSKDQPRRSQHALSYGPDILAALTLSCFVLLCILQRAYYSDPPWWVRPHGAQVLALAFLVVGLVAWRLVAARGLAEAAGDEAVRPASEEPIALPFQRPGQAA